MAVAGRREEHKDDEEAFSVLLWRVSFVEIRRTRSADKSYAEEARQAAIISPKDHDEPRLKGRNEHWPVSKRLTRRDRVASKSFELVTDFRLPFLESSKNGIVTLLSIRKTRT